MLLYALLLTLVILEGSRHFFKSFFYSKIKKPGCQYADGKRNKYHRLSGVNVLYKTSCKIIDPSTNWYMNQVEGERYRT